MPKDQPKPEFVCQRVQDYAIRTIDCPFCEAQSDEVSLLPTTEPEPLHNPRSDRYMHTRKQLFCTEHSVYNRSSRMNPQNMSEEYIPCLDSVIAKLYIHPVHRLSPFNTLSISIVFSGLSSYSSNTSIANAAVERGDEKSSSGIFLSSSAFFG